MGLGLECVCCVFYSLCGLDQIFGLRASVASSVEWVWSPLKPMQGSPRKSGPYSACLGAQHAGCLIFWLAVLLRRLSLKVAAGELPSS